MPATEQLIVPNGTACIMANPAHREDFGVSMWVHVKAAAGLDSVGIQHAQGAKVHTLLVPIASE